MLVSSLFLKDPVTFNDNLALKTAIQTHSVIKSFTTIQDLSFYCRPFLSDDFTVYRNFIHIVVKPDKVTSESFEFCQRYRFEIEERNDSKNYETVVLNVFFRRGRVEPAAIITWRGRPRVLYPSCINLLKPGLDVTSATYRTRLRGLGV